MANAAAYKKIKPWSDGIEQVRLTYDFSKDGGAQGTVTLGEVESDVVIVNARTIVQTQATSGGSATVIVGRTGDTDSILTSTAVASLTANAVIDGASTAKNARIAKDQEILLTIGTADLTAGKIDVVLDIMKQ